MTRHDLCLLFSLYRAHNKMVSNAEFNLFSCCFYYCKGDNPPSAAILWSTRAASIDRRMVTEALRVWASLIRCINITHTQRLTWDVFVLCFCSRIQNFFSSVDVAAVRLRSNSLRVINETADFSRHRRQHRPRKDICSWPLGRPSIFSLSAGATLWLST